MILGIKKGIGFGLTSGVITTLGTLLALYLLSGEKTVIIGGIISIAIADAVSDALGMHISEESEEEKETKHIWTATVWTFLSKFIFAFSFVFPVIFFSLKTAIIVSLIWGYFLITVFSYKIAKDREENPFYAIFEHTFITTVILIIIFFTEKIINKIGV